MSMKAVVYQKPFTLKEEEVPRPKMEHPDDITVKITTNASCAVLTAIISVVRPTGGLGISGLYVPSDPGAAD